MVFQRLLKVDDRFLLPMLLSHFSFLCSLTSLAMFRLCLGISGSEGLEPLSVSRR